MAFVDTSRAFTVTVTAAAPAASQYTSNPLTVRVSSAYFMQRVGTQLVPAQACVRVGDTIVEVSPAP